MLIISVLVPRKKLLYSLPAFSPGVLRNDPGLEKPILELQNAVANNIVKIMRVVINRVLLLIEINHIVHNQYHISSSLVFQILLE